MGDEQDRDPASVDKDDAHTPTGLARPDRPLPADPDRTAEVEVDAAGDRPPAERIRDLEQFEVIGELGRGGMGVVLAAYDPNLDRKIALKVIHRQPIEGGTDGSVRLLREARALAKLAHPNVVAIYDVGHVDDDLYLAMEYVDGPNLDEWLDSEARSFSSILAKFRQAGRGLAAAHATGLVHRDFKPANVLIGSDGRARVSDFGLVSSAGVELAEGEGDLGKLSPSTTLSTTLTVPGTVLGTPLFMAPEQHLRQPVDARSDQFSFCVALYQALFATHPFAGNSYPELRAAVLDHTYRPIPRDSPVPNRVRAAVTRGLARDPARRFPDMEQLLAALDARPRARWLPILAAVAIAGAALAFWLARAPALDACALPAATWAGIWDEETRARAAAAFASAPRPYAADTLVRVSELLDDYVDGWSKMRSRACRAHQRGKDELFDLRMRCLERRRAHVAALTGRLSASIDGDLVDDAIAATTALPALAACANDAALGAAFPLPDDPELRARITELEDRIAESAVAEELGKYDEARVLAEAVVTASAEIDFAPLRAEAGYRLGKAQGKAGDAPHAEANLRDAIRAAASARDDELAAHATIELIFVLGDTEQRAGDALALRDSAEAAVTRAGNPPLLRARLLHTLATVLTGKGDFAAAERLFEQAIALRTAEVGANDSSVGASMTNLGLVLWRQHRIAEARALFERSLAILSAQLGSGHPDVARAHNNLSNALRGQGDLDGAERSLERAIAIWRAAFGDRHPNVARPLANLGNISYARGNLADARKYFEESLAILVATRGPEHVDTTLVLHNLANVLSDSGDREEARRTFERVLRIREQSYGPDHPACASTAGSLGMLLVTMKDFAAARPHLERALATDERVFGRDHINVAYSLLPLGTLAIEEGKPRAAVAPLERALAIWVANQADATDIAESEFELARALWQSRRDRRRALTLAASARERYAAAGDPAREQLARVEAWLAQRQK